MITVEIDKITIGPNRRAIKEQKVAELMESIQANGLLNPITIDQNYNLIAGLHRLTACKLLGFKEIECKVLTSKDTDHARLAEIDENLIRSELDALERAELWLERDRILERMGLRARPGDNQYTQQGSEIVSPPVKTTLELAKEVGYTERTFQQGKQIAKNIVPEVKAAIKGTPIAKSTTALLKVARAGKQEGEKADKAEKATREAIARQKQQEAEQQAKLAAEARDKQKRLQLIALRSVAAEKAAKLAVKEVQKQQEEASTSPGAMSDIQPGDQWFLDRHLIYYGDTSSQKFISCLPSKAMLAIATPSFTWEHDYLSREAQVVAVVKTEGSIHQFLRNHNMPFQFELLIGNLYVAVFSERAVPEPRKPITISGIEAVVAYLINLYTQPGNFVIAPFIGHGEILIACERMGRVCFTGDEDPKLVGNAISRWQKWTGKQAEKIR